MLRAKLDKDISYARSIPESERNWKQKHLAKVAIYFADDQGAFDAELVVEYLQDTRKLLHPNEVLCLEGMRTQTTPIPLIPSKAMIALRKSQESTFGSGNGLLLSHLDPAVLDDCKTYEEIEKKVDKVAREAMEKAVKETDFKLDSTMLQCRDDKTMPEYVKGLVGDHGDLSKVKEWETTTASVAMELVMILVEKQALLALVSGRLRTFTRENGRMAIWGEVPDLRKFYCIGMARRYDLPSRVANIQIADGYKYYVSPNSFEMHSYGCEATDRCFVTSRF
jgi:hypothetical protein